MTQNKKEVAIPGVIVGLVIYVTWVDPMDMSMMPPQILKWGSVFFGACIGYISAKCGL